MKHLEEELKTLKAGVVEMWELVLSQQVKAREAYEHNDKDLAQQILSNEKRVDAFELKIDMDCENILALFNPYANDLRLVLAILKINYNLERIGDYAKTIAKTVLETERPLHPQDMEESKIPVMFTATQLMLASALDAFILEDGKSLKSIFSEDVKLDKINRNVNTIISSLITRNPDEIHAYLNMHSVIRKLERVGDQTKNIAEEIIFYLNAKVLRHKKKKKIIGRRKSSGGEASPETA
jgi:phosphate transport system protein